MTREEVQKIINALERWNTPESVLYIQNGFFVAFEFSDKYSLFYEDTYKRSFENFDELILFKNEMIKGRV